MSEPETWYEQDDYGKLLTSVRRSVRYHNHRRSFFGKVHSLVLFLGVAGGSTPVLAWVFELQKVLDWPNWWVLTPGMIYAAASIMDLIANTADKAWTHKDLARRFIELEQSMEMERAKYSDEDIADWTVERLRIEADEPPVLRILDTMCYNEISLSIGSEDLYKIPIWQRCIAHFSNLGVQNIKPAKSSPRNVA